jgi:hypothetical protein
VDFTSLALVLCETYSQEGDAPSLLGSHRSAIEAKHVSIIYHYPSKWVSELSTFLDQRRRLKPTLSPILMDINT